MTAICVPIFVGAGKDFLGEIREAEEAGADMVELRCDGATKEEVRMACAGAKVPTIVTVRPTWEGGVSEWGDEERLGLYAAGMEAGAGYVDVELVTWEESEVIRGGVQELLARGGMKLIVSNHCFEGRPEDLEERIGRLRAVEEAAVLKVVWKAGTVVEGLEALRVGRDLRRAEGRPVIALAMGEAGLISRVLAKKFGAFLTFATVRRGKESAPGQPTVGELRGLYRWEKQEAGTTVYGVAGNPIGHSLSPAIHNAGFEAAGVEGVYVPLLVGTGYEEFARSVEGLRASGALRFRGLSVTIPHKENALRWALEAGGEVDELTRRIGAANTLVWDEAGKLRVTNSDYAGALDALVSAWDGRRETVAGKRVGVLGAGGAARAIVAALAAHGATVVIYNRTLEKGGALAQEFAGERGKVVAAAWEKIEDSCCDAFINCTPLGMYPEVERTPMERMPRGGGEGVVMFDTVYNPLKTRWLRMAEGEGAKVVTGLEMFVRQAGVQFEMFTGKAGPVEVFRRVMRERLGG